MSGQIAVGLKKGHKVDKRETLLKPGARKGRCGKRVKLIRDLVRDVAGTAPYEKRMMELLKTGRDKRALKLSKRKLLRMFAEKRNVKKLVISFVRCLRNVHKIA